MQNDKIEIEVLADGTIKSSTDKVSMPNHANAESFLAQIARLAGGATTRVRKVGTHSHTHTGEKAHHGHGGHSH